MRQSTWDCRRDQLLLHAGQVPDGPGACYCNGTREINRGSSDLVAADRYRNMSGPRGAVTDPEEIALDLITLVS